MSKSIIACRPHEPPADHPELLQAFYSLPPITAEWASANCQTCGAGIWIGPRQQLVTKGLPVEQLVLVCYHCASEIVRLETRFGNATYDIIALDQGGK